MAQLSSDHFAFGPGLLSVEQALARASANLKPIAEIESVSLVEADGRILAHDLISEVNLPPFFNSAVDGYAVRHADLQSGGETTIPVIGRIAAGGTGSAPLPAGAATRIFTGAPMPDGADTVFMQEDVRLDGDRVILPHGLKPGANCRPAGEDLPQGAVALNAGRRMTPETIALAAALGMDRLAVRRRIRVAIFSTGDELISPGQPLPHAHLYDSNRFTLATLVRRLGADVTDLGILRDSRNAVAEALAAAAPAHDLILTSGGVSTGEEDHVKAAVEGEGSLAFWRLAIKPGRPVAMGVVRGTAFIGLPGNPVAVFVTFAHVVRPFLTALAGGTPERPLALPVRAGFAYSKKQGRREYVRVSLARGSDGVIEAHKHPREGAGVITSLTETDGLVELTEDVTRIEPGAMVGFLSYALLR
jgi:molybdopterin molybdotransferase